MKLSSKRVAPGLALLGLSLLLSVPAVSSGQAGGAKSASRTMTVPDVQCVIGMQGIKAGIRGTASVYEGALNFVEGHHKASVPISSITDIYLGNESRQDISGMGGTAVKAAVPYGGGRLLSLFSHQVEVMTLEYTDSDGGFHGAILVFPVGHATAMKDLLVSMGARTTTHAAEPAEPTELKEQKP